MSDLQAGFGSVQITPDHMGFPMYGYGNRDGVSTRVHDPLWANALVVRQNDQAWALCGADLIAVDAETVAEIRRRVAKRTGLTGEAVLVAGSHTHSGPSVLDAGNWDRPFAQLAADAIVEAWERQAPARVGVGAGFLYGHSINRRWFHRPVDPGVGVLRVDTSDGDLLGLVTNFGCHAVVLGYDNTMISADFVGYARAAVERELGGTVVFTNGGAGDVNPLTETVRDQLARGCCFVTMSEAYYYGDGVDAIPIEDRGGGTFAEAETLGEALAEEVVRIARGLSTRKPAMGPWSSQAWINRLDTGEALIEAQALGIGDFALVAQPGEVFAETALKLKADLRKLGYDRTWLVSYANDWQSYLVPQSAYEEGGYEVSCAKSQHHARQLQDRLWTGISEVLPSPE